MENPRFCKHCVRRVSSAQSFLCKLGYWTSLVPDTIRMEGGKVVRPQECVDASGYVRK